MTDDNSKYNISQSELEALLKDHYQYLSSFKRTPVLKYMHVPSNTNSDHSL